MKIPARLMHLGLSQYEVTAYLALVGGFPVNGSQLSRRSGVPRARIYDVLRTLKDKGLVVEVEAGRYAPLPPEELIKQLRRGFESDLSLLQDSLEEAAGPAAYDFIWTMRGYDQVLAKAREMITQASREIYTRLFPQEGGLLAADLEKAQKRGVAVKYISMGRPPTGFDLQVIHPEAGEIESNLGGRTFDLVIDRQEVLVGVFEAGREDRSPINWARNHWFVVATRDSLRHDFFHYFLYKILEDRQELSARELSLYRLIADDR